MQMWTKVDKEKKGVKTAYFCRHPLWMAPSSFKFHYILWFDTSLGIRNSIRPVKN